MEVKRWSGKVTSTIQEKRDRLKSLSAHHACVFNNPGGATQHLFLRQSRAEVVLSDGEWRGSGIFKRAHVVTARLDERSLGLL